MRGGCIKILEEVGPILSGIEEMLCMTQFTCITK